MNEIDAVTPAHPGSNNLRDGWIDLVCSSCALPALCKRGEGRLHYEMEHQRLTTYVVAPLMLTELASVMLFWWRPDAVIFMTVALGLVLLSLIWLMTYAVQVRQHASLVLSYDASLQQRLVLGNWFRTAAWTARGGLVLWMVDQVFDSVSS